MRIAVEKMKIANKKQVWLCVCVYMNMSVYTYLPTYIHMYVHVQRNLPKKDTSKYEHLSNEDTACCPNPIELCTNLPLN